MKVESKKKAVELTDYLVTVPPARRTLFLLIVVGIVFGVTINLLIKGVSFLSIAEGAGNGVFLLSLPAMLTSITLFILGRRLLFKRIVFLSFVCAAAYGVFYLIGTALSIEGFPVSAGVVFVGFGLIFALWFLMAKIVFNLGRASLLFALIQLVFNSLFLLAGKYITLGGDPFSIVAKIYFASFVFLLSIYFIFWLLNAPMKKTFGVSSTDAAAMFLSQWLNQTKELEGAFERIGRDIETIVGVFGFRGKNINALFVVPCVHFGPFGNLGGSEFSSLISSSLSKDGFEPFVFHGTATHDFDPVSSSELPKVLEGCRRAIGKLEYKKANGYVSVGKAGTSRAHCLVVNDNAFIGLTRAPRTTEDISFSVGLSLMLRAEGYVEKAIVADEHNAETESLSNVEEGNPILFELMDAVGNGLEKKGKKEALLMGTASRFPRVEGIGKNGIRIALFSIGKKKHAYVVFDSNSVMPAFRSEVIDRVREIGKRRKISIDAEIFTTDTHQLSNVKGVMNPVGKLGRETIIGAVEGCVEEALGKLEPVEGGAATERFNIRVFGSGQSAEIVSTVNSVIAVAKVFVPLLLIGTAAFLLWALSTF